jgi:glycosyltransferase involved in cell wall biosynthesis
MRYALVHEWFTPKATGGSELVVQEILRHIEADVYALIDFESNNPQSYLYQRQIGTTFLQHLPLASSGVQKYLPLLPIAIEQLDLSSYDLILSSSHAVAKGILTNPQQLHICYCHTPMRYAWDLTFDYLESNPLGKPPLGIITRYILHRLREWDVISANRVDYFIANSQHTARRIWRCYRREAKVIYPPVNLDRFNFNPVKEDFFLTVSRLVSYKKISLIVTAFNQLGKPLVVIGSGPELEKIRQLAKPNIKILGSQPNEIVAEYMAKAKAFVYAACEDFGIALVEAQACGTPVIAYAQGGAAETVVDRQKNSYKATGILFPSQTSESLITAVNQFLEVETEIKPENCREQAQKFSAEIFKKCYTEFLESCIQQWQTTFSSK